MLRDCPSNKKGANEEKINARRVKYGHLKIARGNKKTRKKVNKAMVEVKKKLNTQKCFSSKRQMQKEIGFFFGAKCYDVPKNLSQEEKTYNPGKKINKQKQWLQAGMRENTSKFQINIGPRPPFHTCLNKK